MLPVIDTPVIQHVVEEAVGAGLPEILVVTSRGKEAIADHFDIAPALESILEAKGDRARLDAVRRTRELGRLQFVRQGEARGLGHAVQCAETFVADEPFAVLLGDDLIDARDPLLTDMVAVQGTLGGSVIALMEVPRNQVSLYGCVAAEAVDEPALGGVRTVRITDMVEKPEPEAAPSNLAIIGRYVLSPSIFAALRETPPGRGGEIQLTDALLHQVRADEPVHGVVFRGRRYDTGNPLDYLRAVVRIACDREDIGPEFRRFLEDFVAGRA